tara:strand:+ start:246 stop:2900 length:2655 start_codon:yes stop_codon:yes gene_type:complete
MGMDGKKPLIFIKPYSKTLQKLLEVMEESSEKQGTEIYEIEELSEAIQIIPQVGQALIISAHPRKTAQLLQASRQFIKKLQTKVILLTPKPLPRKAVDKFMKIGLTECIVEPIAPKTLQYKVNLLLRSIVIRKEETNYDSKFGTGVEDDGSKDLQRRSLEAKENTEEPESESQDAEDIKNEEESAPKKSTYKEEAIGGFYKGKVTKKEDLPEESDQKKQSPLMQSIDGYYKNQLKTQEEEAAEEAKAKKNDATDDDVDELAKRVNLLLEDDESEEGSPLAEVKDEESKPEAKKKLDIEKEDIVADILDEINEEEADEEEIADHHLDLIDEASDDVVDEDEPVEEDEAQEKAKKTKLELEEEAAVEDASEADAESKAVDKKKKSQLDLEEDSSDEESEEKPKAAEKDKKERNSPAKLDIEKEEEEDTSIEDLAEELEKKLRKNKPKLEVEAEAKEKAEREKVEKQQREHKRDKAKLEIEEAKKAEREKQPQKPINEIERKKAAKLEVETDLDYGAAKRKEKEKREREKAQAQLEIEDDTKKRESAGYEEKEINSKSSGYTEHIQENGGNKADAHADDIEGYYDSRRSLEHVDDEWQEMDRERKQKQDRFAMRDNEYIVDPDPDLGEQTIDYSDLKKQFDSTGYSLGSKKEVGIFEDDDKKQKRLGFASAITTQAEQELAAEEVEEAESAASKEGEICEAKLKSGPALIKALSLYLYYTKDREAVIKGILEILRDDLGILIALKYGKGPKDGELKIETIGNWLDQESKDSIINIHKSSADCPIVPAYSDKTFKQKRTTFFYPYTEGITTFAWAQGFFPAGTTEENLRGVEAVLETIRGALLDEFYELGGTGPYAKIEKKKEEKSATGAASKVKNFFGGLFGKKKAS